MTKVLSELQNLDDANEDARGDPVRVLIHSLLPFRSLLVFRLIYLSHYDLDMLINCNIVIQNGDGYPAIL